MNPTGRFEQPDDGEVVIDLPDGQRLHVSHLPVGTFIEVATWRGTGRPDQTTHRLMLGVDGAGPTLPQPVIVPGVTEPWAVPALARPEPRQPVPVNQPEAIRQSAPVRPVMRRRTMSPWLVLLQVVSILVLLAVAVWLSPFRLEHPRAGTPLAPGEVTTSLVVINTWIAEFTPGEAVLIRTGAGTTDPVLAVVSEVSGSVLTVTAGSQTLTASGDAILGRVVLVVPYLGVIPTALGL